MPTYVELTAQIKTLQKQTEAVRQTEISEVKQEISDYNLAAGNLVFATTRSISPKRSVPVSKRDAVKPRYQVPTSGKIWSSRGMMPRWVKAALEAGYIREEFLVPEI
ncbi:HNS-like transcription regulator protein [Thauera linaloolentis 47Lol = DSM 12138]|uniref:HNS-like transcription regulator protein n=2 Tax=Thauera linaloolentis TaxID=76112 RepID=N6ZCM0_THAL4|nr:H-NS histone family protein [Thauera linaloolentis]ENO89894.1 HNS-like transcription regulator protein [Thauera linaloolentis 47Lol = DSM 12138]